MTGRVEVTGADTVQWMLTAAVLVYQGDGKAYATVHGIEGGSGKRQRLGAGQPATKEACAHLARSLGAMAGISGFTPANLLYLGARSLIWWRPPMSARMFFDSPKERADGLQGSAVTPQPGLVFAVTGGRWYVHAVADDARPGPATKLHQAPYFNVYANGNICTGNVQLPDTLSPTSLEQYERAFFDSNFTHSNVKRLVRGAKAAAFWREGLQGKWGNRFPTRALLPRKLTLEAFAKDLDEQKEGRNVLDLG